MMLGRAVVLVGLSTTGALGLASAALRRSPNRLRGRRGAASNALDQVEASVDRVLAGAKDFGHIQTVPLPMRESVSIARVLRFRLDALRRNGDCRACWLHMAHCVCSMCLPLEEQKLDDAGIGDIYCVLHHKEVGLVVDTAKLILAAYPTRAKIVVGGLDEQPNMDSMLASIAAGNALVLFPDDDAVSVEAVPAWTAPQRKRDLIVLDGTWAQARKLHAALPQQAQRLKLDLGGEISDGQRQLRSHPTSWREISTLEALRLLLQELKVLPGLYEPLAFYQSHLHVKALKQLGPKRLSPKYVDAREQALAADAPNAAATDAEAADAPVPWRKY
ncbi:DTW domain-containing protein [Pelagophyceae sp. CCMP2097]|nr:DTW domain-containing protein [Pelagophyceae sp. CCMP2097]|mmetsp:Transcript_23704/g.80976  ORF Transcript_23704/g.80976 Transcript_23704/m.80976 type:complete len:332 (+) Transcript_23704:92-1087(+)